MRKLTVLVLLTVMLAVAATSLVLYRGQRRLREDIRELRWELAVTDAQATADNVSMEIGVIQFLRKGYSITFASVSYDQNGVLLVGHLGNPTLLTISSLTLNVVVTKPRWTYRKEFLADPNPFNTANGETVGKAQVSVGTLLPGSQARFRVTVPNVKQSNEGYDVQISFSAERYSYLR